MTTRKMRINAAKQARRESEHKPRCSNCGGRPIGELALVDARTEEEVATLSLCLPPDKKELN